MPTTPIIPHSFPSSTMSCLLALVVTHLLLPTTAQLPEDELRISCRGMFGQEAETAFATIPECFQSFSSIFAGNRANKRSLCPSMELIEECIEVYKTTIAPPILSNCAVNDDIPGAVCFADSAQKYGTFLVLAADSLL